MKSMNKMAAAAALVLSSTPMAFATTYHVAGSTAFRVADVTAEVSVCGGATAKATIYGAAGTSLTGANVSVVQNSAGTIKFENVFNGSIAGDQALEDGVTTFAFPAGTATGEVPTTVTSAGSSTAPATGGTAGPATPAAVENVSPDISFSDVSNSTALQIINSSADHAVTAPAGDVVVGVVPFVFVANGTSDVYSRLGGLSITPQNFTFIWNSGSGASLSFLTGIHADENTVIYPMGRDVDSGTRAQALAETGYGLTGSGNITTAVVQYYPYASTGAAGTNNDTTGVIGNDSTLVNPTIEAIAATPAKIVDSYSEVAGNGGYNSGGNLAKGVSTVIDSTSNGPGSSVLVTYLGVSDATSALGATGTNRQAAKLLAYNGTTFVPNAISAANSSLIYEGTYTYWGFEHALSKSVATTVASQLATALTGGLDQLSSNGVNYNTLITTISRPSGDGQLIQ